MVRRSGLRLVLILLAVSMTACGLSAVVPIPTPQSLPLVSPTEVRLHPAAAPSQTPAASVSSVEPSSTTPTPDQTVEAGAMTVLGGITIDDSYFVKLGDNGWAQTVALAGHEIEYMRQGAELALSAKGEAMGYKVEAEILRDLTALDSSVPWQQDALGLDTGNRARVDDFRRKHLSGNWWYSNEPTEPALTVELSKFVQAAISRLSSWLTSSPSLHPFPPSDPACRPGTPC